MIVVDGDSVAKAIRKTVTQNAWYDYVARSRNTEVVSLCKESSTARDCFFRLYRLKELKPDWYFLMIGQWSQNHETLEEFEMFTRKIIEAVPAKVCLITPPRRITYLGEIENYVYILRKCSKIYRTALVDLFAEMQTYPMKMKGEIEQWLEIENVTCHLNGEGNRRLGELFDREENKWIGA